MHGRRQKELKARLAGLSIVLALHGALFYSLWHYRVLPPPAEAATLFVDLLTDPPRLEPPRPDPPKPKPVKREQPVQPPLQQQLVVLLLVVLLFVLSFFFFFL